jgi:alpha-galactosidase
VCHNACKGVSVSKIITVIGAASITFGPKILRDIINHPELDGCTFRFVDINEKYLDIYQRLAKRITENIEHAVKIEADTDRKKMLPGSDFVIGSVEIKHYEFWEKDFTIPRSLGSRQINGELGGPGGMFHAFRQIPVHLEIAQDIEKLCPKAMVMLVSNPLNRICLALERHSHIGQVVGLCHGVEMAEKLILNKILDMDGYDIDALAAGTNHLSWIVQLRHRKQAKTSTPFLKRNSKPLTRTGIPCRGGCSRFTATTTALATRTLVSICPLHRNLVTRVWSVLHTTRTTTKVAGNTWKG